MNAIQTTQQKIDESIPVLIELIANGGFIETYSEVGVVYAAHIYKLPMKVLEKNLLNVIAKNEAFNQTTRSLFDKKLSNDSSVVKNFFAVIDEFKSCIARESFTDAFEQAIKLKLILATSSEINQFTGDADLGLAMGSICRKMTSEFFNVLEAMEKDHKRMLSLQFSQMLES